MKKASTTYYNNTCHITVNEEVKDHISVHDGGEPCSGLMRHWGSKKEIIKELEEIIEAIKNLTK